MRIGFDAKRLYCNFTGLGNYSRTLLKNLADYYPENEYYLYTTKIRSNPDTVPFLKGDPYHTIIAKSLLKGYWRSFSITKQLKEQRIEIFHGLSNELPFNIHRSKIRSVVSIHDLIYKIYPQTYAALDRKIYDVKFKNSCVHADRVVAISNNTKKDIIKFYNIDPEKIDVVYQSCHPIYFQPRDTEHCAAVLQQYKIPSEFILSVGTVEERKNLKLVIEAYRQLKPANQIPLVVIGGGKRYKHEVKELVAKKGLEKLVIWVDNLKDINHLQAFYQCAMALVYPSKYEGFGLPIVEAMLSRTPVITSNVSSLPEAGGPDTLYVNPNSSAELAQAISSLLNDGELRKKIVEKGYQYAIDNFSAQKITEQMHKSYQKALQH